MDKIRRLNNILNSLKSKIANRFRSKEKEKYAMLTLMKTLWGLYQLISDKVNFRANKVSKDKEGHCVTIKGPIHQEDRIILNMYIPSASTLKYMKLKW